MIAAMMPELKEALRSDDVVLNPPSIMDAVFDAECTRIKDEVLSAAKSGFESAAIPMDAAALANLKQTYIVDFHGRTSSYPVANRNKVLASFNSTLDAFEKNVEEKNGKALAEQALEKEKNNKSPVYIYYGGGGGGGYGPSSPRPRAWWRRWAAHSSR